MIIYFNGMTESIAEQKQNLIEINEKKKKLF